MIRFNVEARRGDFAVRGEWESDARVAGLCGPTGSGKTSLLLVLAGLARADRGRIELDGEILLDTDRGIVRPPERRGLGVVFQDDRLFPHLSVRENLCFGRPPEGRRGPSFDETVHLLDLEALLSRGVAGLSGGERRLVAVGRALLVGPRLLLLDEPLTGLDPARRRRVLAYLLRLKQSLDVHMLLVSHVFSDFLALADAMALMESGRLTASGAPGDLFDRAMPHGDGDPLETAILGTVVSVEGEGARLEADGVRFEAALTGARVGASALVSLGARDVIVGVGSPPRTSARNVFPGRIVEIRKAGGSAFLKIDAGPQFWAQVTEDSVRELGLECGSSVFALVKASALRGEALPPRS